MYRNVQCFTVELLYPNLSTSTKVTSVSIQIKHLHTNLKAYALRARPCTEKNFGLKLYFMVSTVTSVVIQEIVICLRSKECISG